MVTVKSTYSSRPSAESCGCALLWPWGPPLDPTGISLKGSHYATILFFCNLFQSCANGRKSCEGVAILPVLRVDWLKWTHRLSHCTYWHDQGAQHVLVCVGLPVPGHDRGHMHRDHGRPCSMEWRTWPLVTLERTLSSRQVSIITQKKYAWTPSLLGENRIKLRKSVRSDSNSTLTRANKNSKPTMQAVEINNSCERRADFLKAPPHIITQLTGQCPSNRPNSGRLAIFIAIHVAGFSSHVKEKVLQDVELTRNAQFTYAGLSDFRIYSDYFIPAVRWWSDEQTLIAHTRDVNTVGGKTRVRSAY